VPRLTDERGREHVGPPEGSGRRDQCLKLCIERRTPVYGRTTARFANMR
jgi:hypothetical protein